MGRKIARVLFHPFFFQAETWNGMDEHLLLLSRHLDRDRFEPLVLAHDGDGPQTRLLAERAGIRALTAPYPPGADVRQRLAALRNLYAAETIDLVHIHSPVAGGQTVPALASRLGGVAATLATYHQIQPRRLPAKSRAINYLTHTTLLDTTIAVSGGVRRSLAAVAGLPLQRIRVVHNGIDLSPDARSNGPLPTRVPGEVRIGYFGRLSPEKGVAVLLEAMALVAPGHPWVRLLIVGDGPLRAELEAMAARLAIANRVQFLGFRPDARALMAEVDVVAHAPAYEGFGLVVLEAMAAGAPVVVNDAPGAPAEIVVHGVTGLVVPAGSARTLAGALVRLAEDPEERSRMGQNGRARCGEQFSARLMTEQTEALYEHALNLRRARARKHRSP